MGHEKQESDSVAEAAKEIGNDRRNMDTGSKSNLLRRLGILLGVFVVAAGGIWGYQEYLKSTMPKEDANFVKEKAPGAKEPDPEPSGLSVLSDLFGAPKPSKEIEELKKKTAKEVEFTYDAIIKMTPKDLEENIKDVSDRLTTMRKSLAPSIGGATAGPSGPPKDDSSEAPAVENDGQPTISSLALPLEVMRQIAESKK